MRRPTVRTASPRTPFIGRAVILPFRDHHDHPQRIVQYLLLEQDTGLAPERHWTHHRDRSRGFCVTSGWMNRLLEPIRFFPRLERGLRVLQSPATTRRDLEAERR